MTRTFRALRRGQYASIYYERGALITEVPGVAPGAWMRAEPPEARLTTTTPVDPAPATLEIPLPAVDPEWTTGAGAACEAAPAAVPPPLFDGGDEPERVLVPRPPRARR